MSTPTVAAPAHALRARRRVGGKVWWSQVPFVLLSAALEALQIDTERTTVSRPSEVTIQ